MAEQTFNVRLITPEQRLLDAEVVYASVPMWDGQRGEMHRSGALVGKLGPGTLRLDFPGGESKSYFVDGGFMQNVSDTLTILAEGATPLGELDIEELRAALAESNARKPQTASEQDALLAECDRLRRKLAAATSR